MKAASATATLAAVLALASPSFAAGDVAESPAEIRPLLVGTAAPSGIEVRTTDGAPFDLSAAFSKKATVLVLYRGGW